jgi:hypothetical protein
MAAAHTRIHALHLSAFTAQKAAFDRRAELRILKVGDVVYVTAPHTGTLFQKFQAPFQGPFTVVKILQHNNYELWSPNRRSPLKCHINRIKVPSYSSQLGWMDLDTATSPVSDLQAPRWHDAIENTLRRTAVQDEDEASPAVQGGVPQDVPPDVPPPVPDAQDADPEPEPEPEVRQPPPPTPVQPGAAAGATGRTAIRTEAGRSISLDRKRPAVTRKQAERSGHTVVEQARVMPRPLERKERADKGRPKSKPKPPPPPQ